MSRTTAVVAASRRGRIYPHSSSRRRRQVVRQRSAKPPSPVQLRAAPPILTSMHTVACVDRRIFLGRQLTSVYVRFAEQPFFHCFNREVSHNWIDGVDCALPFQLLIAALG